MKDGLSLSHYRKDDYSLPSLSLSERFLPSVTFSPSLQDQNTSIIHSSLTAPLYDYPSSNTTRYTVPNHHASAPTSPESGSVNWYNPLALELEGMNMFANL